MSVFLTGFPGFLGVALTERLLARGKAVTCLVQPRYLEVAQERAGQLQAATDAPGAGLRLVTGDITGEDLALAEPARLADRTVSSRRAVRPHTDYCDSVPPGRSSWAVLEHETAILRRHCRR